MSRFLTYGSVCSGIEAATVAFSGLGWKPTWFSEIEKFPSAVLNHHYPTVPNLGDMTALPARIASGEIESPDILCGGTPCQSFSVAGRRESLDDNRGNLTLTFCEIADAIDTVRSNNGEPPSIVLWENVPGVLNTKDNAFGCFLGALSGAEQALTPSCGSKGHRWSNAGYVLGSKRAVAWRVLDAQYFGLAQRRKRVFVVASAREGFCPAKVLFEFDGVRRDIAPSREAGENTTTDAGRSVNATGSYGELVGTLCARDYKGVGNQYVSEGKLIVENPNSHLGSEDATGFRQLTFGSYAQDETASTMMARDYKSHTDLEAFNSRQDPVSGGVFGALDTCSPQAQAIAIQNQSKNQNNCLTPDQPQVWRVYDPNGVSPTLQSGEARGNIIADQHRQSNITPYSVRRLTPIECERLQGFPDNYTQIPWRNKPSDECPDGHRYKALGNSWAVPVIRWIGSRIQDNVTQIDSFKAHS